MHPLPERQPLQEQNIVPLNQIPSQSLAKLQPLKALPLVKDHSMQQINI